MNKIIELQFGSHLYGTNTENSDTDIKGIYLPTAREIVLHSYARTISTSRPKGVCERNKKDDVDTEYFSLDRYLELLCEGQTVALDMLFSPYFVSEGNDITRAIYENKDKLLTRNINAFVGYARQQAAKYGIKGSRMDALKRVDGFLTSLDVGNNPMRLADYPATVELLVKECSELISLEKSPLVEIVMLKGPQGKEDAPHLRVNGRSIPFHATVKYARMVVGKMLDSYGQRAHKAHLAGGYDFKALSHAVRVNNEAMEILSTGKITFPRPDKDLLVKIKLGILPYEEIAELIEQGVANLTEQHRKSSLRDLPDKEWVENFIYSVYSEIVKNND